jgi:hypothetical protein
MDNVIKELINRLEQDRDSAEIRMSEQIKGSPEYNFNLGTKLQAANTLYDIIILTAK